MAPSIDTRTLLVVAVLAGALGLIYAPFHAAAYLATEDGADSQGAVPWVGPFRDIAGSALTFDAPYEVYKTYGKILFLVFVGYLAGTIALHRLQASAGNRLERMGFRVLMVTQPIMIVGAAAEYWTPYTDEVFVIVVPTLLATMVGYALFGLGARRAGRIPQGAAWLLALGGPLIIPMVALFGHIPMGFYAWNIAWIWVGVHLLRRPTTDDAATALDEQPA